MNEFFLYHRSTSPTGRLIAKALGIPYGHLGPGQTDRRVRRIRSSLIPATSIIRWGSQQELPSGCRPLRTLNSVAALSTSSNKLLTLEKLRDSGVSTCPFSVPSRSAASETGFSHSLTLPLSELERLREHSGVILGRSLHGTKGRDIRVFHEGEIPWGCEFYSAYIPNTREYRVHIFQGEVIRVQGKYLDFPEQHTNPYIKNHGQGFRFRTPEYNLNQDRLDAAVRAVEALGLDFGAVDLLKGEDGQTYVLEVNTAPACSPLTARAYIGRFAEWLGIEPNYELVPVRPRELVTA